MPLDIPADAAEVTLLAAGQQLPAPVRGEPLQGRLAPQLQTHEVGLDGLGALTGEALKITPRSWYWSVRNS